MNSCVPSIISKHMDAALSLMLDDGDGGDDTASEGKPRTLSKELIMSCIGCITWLCNDHKTNQRKFRQSRFFEIISEILKLTSESDLGMDAEFRHRLVGALKLLKKKRSYPNKDKRLWRKMKKNKRKRHIHGAPWWKRYKLRPDKYGAF